MRAYFVCEKGRTKVDELLKQHCFFHDKVNGINDVGPIWSGRLWDKALVKSMLKEIKKSKFQKEYVEAKKLIDVIAKESEIDIVCFYDLHRICRQLKIYVPKKEMLFKKIRDKGYAAADTHFNKNGFRSDISFDELKDILKTKN